ncbi:hydroxymethylglutaryl-CoA lyase [Sphingobium sp. EM0848]|uniref:hydroxymethylglutaryl-CoA lyase n=1 Tax=Sphingobium sp. EM0848 TaxID=2743473 RepID=UPI002100809D|nr:hydroxymethylglutaryl-CoA lyase [Sphingobium sp. EM0848]
MISQPGAAELVQAVIGWLADQDAAARSPYMTRVAINALTTVQRELEQGGVAEAEATRRLAGLLGRSGDFAALNAGLVEMIRAGAMAPDDPVLLDHLSRTALAMIAIDQPRYRHALTEPKADFAPRALPVTLVEVSPRDGLQNEKTILPTAIKVELIARAVAAGVKRIEVASFVHPGKVPQMADAEAVIAALPHMPDVETIGLVLNKRGALRALETAVDEIGMVCVASDAFGQRNQGQTVDQSIAAARDVLRLAHDNGRSAQVTVAVAFGCPFTGRTDPARVVDIVRQLAAFAPREIALADTIGVARPAEVTSLIAKVQAEIGAIPLRVHFHDTRGTGVVNAVAAIAAGVRTVDAAIGGTGGCPFAPGAAGNVASEDVVYATGDATGLDLGALIDSAGWLSRQLGKVPASALAHAGDFIIS